MHSKKHHKNVEFNYINPNHKVSDFLPDVQKSGRIDTADSKKYHTIRDVEYQPENISTFENFIGRVITSVQHRKKNPRLKSLFVKPSEHFATGLATTDQGDYTSVGPLAGTGLVPQDQKAED